MALRFPTQFNQYNDESGLYARQKILGAVPAQFVNDQQFCQDVERMILSECFRPVRTVQASFGTNTLHQWRIREKRAGATHHSSSTIASTVLAWASDGSTNFTVRLATSTGNADFVVTTNNASKIWRAFDTTQIWAQATNGNTVSLYMKRDSGAGTVYCAGVASFYT